MSGINPNEDYAHTLKLLLNMGFTDLELCRKACHAAGGVFPVSVEYLTTGIPEKKVESNSSRRSSTTTRPSSSSMNASAASKPQLSRFTFPKLSNDLAQKVLQCAGMGFSDEGKIRHALSNSNWEVAQAIESLLNDVGLDSSFSSFESTGTTLGSKSNLASSKTNLSNVYTAPSFSNTPLSQNHPLNHSSSRNLGAVALKGNENINYDLFKNPTVTNTTPIFRKQSNSTQQNIRR